jgi:predicted DNA-binding transcriptional regulator AlpA
MPNDNLAVRFVPVPDDAMSPTDPLTHLRSRPEASAIEPLLLTAVQAAALCGVSEATWYRMASARRCPAPVRLTARGCVRWRVEELRAWIGSGCPDRRTWETLKKSTSR